MREIEILDHLSYIIEAIAVEASGEAKSETDRLAQSLESAADLDPDVRRRVLEGVHAALREFKEHRHSVREGAGPLCGASRYLWERVLRGPA
jgi:hypothetical protein